jgi:hypothetical protein
MGQQKKKPRQDNKVMTICTRPWMHNKQCHLDTTAQPCPNRYANAGSFITNIAIKQDDTLKHFSTSIAGRSLRNTLIHHGYCDVASCSFWEPVGHVLNGHSPYVSPHTTDCTKLAGAAPFRKS